MSKSLYMETTEIAPEKSAGEIIGALVAHGATKIMQDYVGGEVTAITFCIVRDRSDVPFRLPVRIDPVFRVLNGRRKHPSDRNKHAPADLAQAKRVAWRQVLRWVQAQLALVDTGMAPTEEVFLPYLTNGRTTLYEAMKERGFRALPAPAAGGGDDER